MIHFVKLAASAFRLANHDFCPKLNPYVRWLKQPFGWVVAALLFSVLIGLLVGPQGWALAVAFLSLLIIGLAWPWLSMRGIRCSLVLPNGKMQENQADQLVLKISNFWPIPVYGLIVEGDFLQNVDAQEEPIAFSLRRIGALSVTEFPIQITPRRRGLMPSGEVHVKNGFPFGLVDVSKPVTCNKRALVWPQGEALHGSPPAEGDHANLFGSISNRSGNDGETIGVRCFRQGDGLRSIHWAQTARSRELMVRERQTPSATSTLVLLDLNPDHHAGRGSQSSFEWAIRIAASICLQVDEMQSRVRVVCIGLPRDQQNSVSNSKSIAGVMEFLARLPTFASQRDVDSKLLQRRFDVPALSQQSFLVGTLQSTGDFAGLELHPVLIDTETLDHANDRWLADSPESEGGIVVTAPELALGQLGFAWNRSFGHATG